MKKPIAVPDGFVERLGIHSGIILHNQKRDEYGVIFSANGSNDDYERGRFERPTPEDFDPEDLQNAVLENVDLEAQQEPDRFFKILGGYFFDDDNDVTVKVFGIASHPDFGIAEGGTKLLDANFTSQDPDKPMLDERNESSGWTFIVERKPREKFPLSHRPMRIFALCPEIEAISVAYGDCDEQGRRKVTFTPKIVDGPPAEFVWDFGDGSSELGQGMPGNTDHYFKTKPASSVKLTVKGSQICDQSVQEVSLKDFKPCEPEVQCPEIVRIDHEASDPDENTRRIDFTAVFKEGTPDELEWNFGDGSTPVKSNELTASHAYRRPEGSSLDFTVKLTSRGPGECQDSAQTRIGVPGISIAGWCSYLPLIIAFLLAMTYGTLTVTWCHASTDLPAAPWLVFLLVVFAVLSVAAIVFWYKQCDPTKCDWMSIVWVTLLAGMLVMLYVTSCCNLVVIAVLNLLVGGGLLLVWSKQCRPTFINVVYRILICLAAASLVSFLIAGLALAGCL